MNKDNFKWTESLVKEFAAFTRRRGYISSDYVIELDIEAFKSSHASLGDEKVDWEIVEFWYDGKNVNVVEKRNDRDGRYYYQSPMASISGTLEYHLSEPRWAIHKVKRLSDGVVFSVGDEVIHKLGTDNGIINRFEISGRQIVAYFNGVFKGQKDYKFYNGIEVLQPLPKRTKLFTTEDGVDIFQGHEGKLWRVFTTPHSYEMWKPYDLGLPQYINLGEKYFSTEEKAKEYITLNKPCLSAADIFALWSLEDGPRKMVIELAKKKLGEE